MRQIVGLQWKKCDFHLHTTASECFKDKTSVTAEMWVEAAIQKKLDCIAITDHNSANGIDGIINVAKNTSLTVFPGVEVTCDTSKVHVLVLFDVNKTSKDVEDFLIECGIKRSDFGKQEAYTAKSVIDIAKLAYKNGCIPIPAHVDDYSGLESASESILEELYNLENINAVQFVHKEFLNAIEPINSNSELKKYFDEYYRTNMSFDIIKSKYKPVKKAIDKNKALLTFSDNPHEPSSAKHGVWGIGNNYSWIKMEENPTLESLRQALLLPSLRVKNCFDSELIPYSLPNLWIKSISINDTLITNPSISTDFSPQLTTIIGGRGSGKSSILRFLRGAFSKNIDPNLQTIFDDQNNFYKKTARDDKGVLKEKSNIEIIFSRNQLDYKILITSINSHDNQKIKIEKFNAVDQIWEVIEEEKFIDFFEFEHYSQKEIYEIAQKPNSLREKIDKAIDNLEDLKQEINILEKQYLEKSSHIRTLEKEISTKSKLQTEIKDLKDQIELYKKSKIAELLNNQKKFKTEKREILRFIEILKDQKETVDKFIEEFEVPQLKLDVFAASHRNELQDKNTKVENSYKDAVVKLNEIKNSIISSVSTFENEIKNSSWNRDFLEHSRLFKVEKEKLEKEGIKDIESFEKLTQLLDVKNKSLDEILTKETTLKGEHTLKESLLKEYIKKREKISEFRNKFLSELILDNKVKINLKPFRDKNSFEQYFREITQRENAFSDDIAELENFCFKGKLPDNLSKYRDLILKIRKKITTDEVKITGHFKNLIQSLDDAQIDKLMLLTPEDEIDVQYKPTEKSSFKSLSTASAGQKTTAILTFILSYGDIPLILDQPEDDLDNRLVYDLIVDRLKLAKEKRQIIIVTHNANIPVNGDAEYIISMDAESKYLNILAKGSVDTSLIKKEICDVMEGSEIAFDMRSKRYKNILEDK